MPMGVTDGSNALPGQVGEWFAAQATIGYQANVTLNSTVSVGTLPPGDWDIWTFVEINPSTDTFLDQIDFYLSPQPPGFSQPIGQNYASADPAAAVNFVPQSAVGRANTTVPTGLVYALTIVSTSGGAGSINLIVNARRMR